jgi:cytochrome c biogenesis protein CcdA
MRVYDIALMLVRALVAMDVIRSALNVVYTGIHFAFLIDNARDSVWLTKVELSTWFSPIYGFVAALVLYACSKPIARFASKLAASTDAATHF